MARDKKNDLDLQIRELTKENKKLRKELGRLRKDSVHSQEALVINQEYARELDIKEEKDKIKRCKNKNCLGELKRFKIRNISYDICQKCKGRTKVEEQEVTNVAKV